MTLFHRAHAETRCSELRGVDDNESQCKFNLVFVINIETGHGCSGPLSPSSFRSDHTLTPAVASETEARAKGCAGKEHAYLKWSSDGHIFCFLFFNSRGFEPAQSASAFYSPATYD